MINDDISITNIFLHSHHHLYTNTQLYTPEISTVITHPGGIHPTTQTEKLYIDGAHTVDLKLLCDHKQAKSFHLAV